MFGHSFEPDFASSTECGRLISPTEDAYDDIRSIFADSFRELEDGLRRIQRSSEVFDEEDTIAIINNSNALADSFQRNAGNIYAVEATGDEFNIRDDFFADTTYVDMV